MGKSQSFNFDHINDSYSDQDALGNDSKRTPKKSILVIGPLGILLGILLIVVLCLATGLIVYFLHPNQDLVCDETPSAGDNVTWAICLNMSRQLDECLPFEPCPSPITEEPSTNQPIISDQPMTPDGVMTSEEPPLSLHLPQHLKPLHYNIDIKPYIYSDNPDDFNFTGNVKIFLRCEEATNQIYIHYTTMEIDNTTVVVRDENEGGSVVAIESQTQEQWRDFYIITLERTLTIGDMVSVWMEFAGPLFRDMRGMYWSTYPENNGTATYMLATQFEPIDARKAFPCLDEPHLKATFNVSLWRKEPMIALSNMPNHTSQVIDDWIRDSFETTSVLMPTYLVAFAIAQYDYIENTTVGGPNIGNQKYVRIYTRPAFIEAGFADYAADITAPMFDYFEEYFNQPYSLPKTDQITIPDFSAGAMENWGLITYRESRLLDDPRYTSLYDKWRFTKTISHELLHQWLGNIVTCDWWGDLWLQEGAARYFENKAVQYAQPDWDMADTYLAYTFYRALSADQTGSSHPLHNPDVETYSEIDAMFSSITYDKGSTVYRMIEEVIFKDEPAAFVEAMRDYVQLHLFSVANHNDLLGVFDRAAQAVGIDVNVTQVIDTWIKQMGYPVVTLTLNEGRSNVDVTQHMFLMDSEKPIKESYPSKYNYAWEVPFSYFTSTSNTPTYTWMHQDNISITLDSQLPQDGWIIGNHQQLGFYRVNYDSSNWEALIKQLATDHEKIDVTHRAQILEDSLDLARAGESDQIQALRATEYLTNETEWLPWYAATNALVYVDGMLLTEVEYGMFERYMLQLVDNNYMSLGWTLKEDFMDVFKQVLAMQLACKYGQVHCIARAVDLFKLWKSDPANLTIIAPEFRRAVYYTAIEHSVTPDDWNFMFDQYMKVDHELERVILRDALARTREPWILKLYFGMAAEQDPHIYSTDSTSVMRSVARNYPTGHMVAYEYIDQHWDNMTSSKFTVMENIVAIYSSEYDFNKLLAFMARHPADTESEANRYNNMIYTVKANIRWRNANGNNIIQWLTDVWDRNGYY